MVTDAQVRRLRQKLMDGQTQQAAAAAAGMSDRSARTWKDGPMPSARKPPRTWRARLGPELRVGLWFRRLASRLTPGDLDALVELAITDGVMPVVRAAARFNWHRELILKTFRHPGVLQIVLKRFIRPAARA